MILNAGQRLWLPCILNCKAAYNKNEAPGETGILNKLFQGIKCLYLQILAITLENVNGGILIYEGNWDSQKN